MAYTTHGFPYPTGTGLVKDGAQNFNDLANTVDSKMGLYYIGSYSATAGSATLIIDGCFSSSFRNYRIVCSFAYASSGWPAIYFYLRTGGVDQNTGNNYYYMGNGRTSANVDGSYGTGAANNGYIGSTLGSFVVDIMQPFIAANTSLEGNATFYDGSVFFNRTIGNWHNLQTSYNGIKFYTASSTFGDFTVKIYGYN